MRTVTGLILAVVMAAVVFIWYSGKNFTPHIETAGHYHGDLQDQLETFTAGLNFAHCGFRQTHFLPYITQYRDDCQFSGAPYTHLLVGSQWVSGALQRLGLKHFHTQRLAMYALSLLTVWLWWRIAGGVIDCDVGKQQATGLICLALILASPWLIFWAGNLYIFTYWDFFAAWGIWLLLQDRKRLFAVGCFVGAFFDYELVPFLFLAGAFRVFQDWRTGTLSLKRAITWVFLFGLAPIGAMGLMFLLNVSYWGSLERAAADLLDAAARRTGITDRYSVSEHAAKYSYTLLWFYGIPVVLLATIGCWEGMRRRIFWPVAVLAAGLAWPVVFHSHSSIHAFTGRLVGPGMFLCAAVGGITLLTASRRGLRWSGGLLVLLAVLRLPLGTEISQNSVALRFWGKAVRATDPATLCAVLDGARTTTEHQPEKQILIEELCRRTGIATNQPGYKFTYIGKSFVLGKMQFRHVLEERHLPADVVPEFVAGVPVYSDHRDALRLLTTTPQEVAIPGTPRRLNWLLLSFFLRLI